MLQRFQCLSGINEFELPRNLLQFPQSKQSKVLPSGPVHSVLIGIRLGALPVFRHFVRIQINGHAHDARSLGYHTSSEKETESPEPSPAIFGISGIFSLALPLRRRIPHFVRKIYPLEIDNDFGSIHLGPESDKPLPL